MGVAGSGQWLILPGVALPCEPPHPSTVLTKPAWPGLSRKPGYGRCRRAFCWNSMWRNLQRHEVIESSGEVNWLIDGPCGERLPAIDLAHVDLTGGEQRPEQQGGSLC